MKKYYDRRAPYYDDDWWVAPEVVVLGSRDNEAWERHAGRWFVVVRTT